MTIKHIAVALLGIAPLLGMAAGGAAPDAASSPHLLAPATPAVSSARQGSLAAGMRGFELASYNTPVGASDTSRHATNA